MIDFLLDIWNQFVVLAGRLWAWFLLTDVGMWLRTYGEWLGFGLFIACVAGLMLWAWHDMRSVIGKGV